MVGYRGASPALMGACAERQIGLSFLTRHGRFLARISGPVNGNILLRTAQACFDAFPQLILKNRSVFSFDGRTRRPPLDPVNAMLSFVYTLLGNEIAGALETVGLDPAVGFLHTLRPERSSLALDMLEELRAPLADRFVLSLINLGKITEKDFDKKENGAVYLTDKGRRTFLDA